MAEKTDALDEARQIVETLSQSLPVSISVASLGVLPKAPYNALAVREALIWRMEELGRVACEAIERGDIVAGALLTRAALEGAALMWDLHEVVRTRGAMTPEALDARIYALIVGQRMDKEQVQMRSVMTLLDRLDKRLPGTRERYEYLSEYAHPNWSGVSGAYSRINTSEFTTTFGRNPRLLDGMAKHASAVLAVALTLFRHDYDAFADLMPAWLSELQPL